MTDKKERQEAAQPPKPAIIEEPKLDELTDDEKLKHPALASYVRRELTPFPVKVKQEREYLLSLRNKEKHDFVILRKEPNRGANTKQLRSTGAGAYSPVAPCVEVMFLYDASTTLDQILKKETRGDVIVDYNFTDKVLEDAQGDKRLLDIISYVNKELAPPKEIQKKLSIREKMKEYEESGKVDSVQVSKTTLDKLYAGVKQ